ncbi:LytR/AlgR family response regulator transcription factor [Sphingomonas quercus]|uniref:LytTR family DNA-binding domain-containing protein n=1 Tax=Sphingomonas quercus TaxID=2842451 RepID=A0ABS6BKQ3_9SPHN|nr:LytTR family DNA-binding domain-containing protein [Sphingomonas quercus]MBU3078202.1 LytTR family DNA-binding domain-containing protein [Sphingomonas quercus]
MRVLIVDDEPLALDRLEVLFGDIPEVELIGRAADGQEAVEAVARLLPDLVLLDVEMPGRNGLRTAHELNVEPRPELIFVTAHEHYAPDAFEVDAADYLLKPVRFDRLRQAVERARRRRALRDQAGRVDALETEMAQMRANAPGVEPGLEDDGFWVPERHGQRRVPLDAISWIEAAKDYVLLHTPTRSHMVRTTMGALEERLTGTRLMRVHRSAIVRPDRVAEVRRQGRNVTLVLEDGAQVQVGPNYLKRLEQVLGL